MMACEFELKKCLCLHNTLVATLAKLEVPFCSMKMPEYEIQ